MRFDPSTIANAATIVILAKRGAGKSFLCRDLMNHLRHYPSFAIICPTDRETRSYDENIEETSFIHYEFTEPLMENILNRQSAITTKAVDYLNKGKILDPRMLLVLDDIQGDTDILKKSKSLKRLFLNGRHLAITLIIICQSAKGIPPDLRENTDYVFILKNNSIGAQKKAHECYGGALGKFSDFRKVHAELTTDRKCIVIDNKTQNENCVFWYKASPVQGKIKFCSNSFRTFHKKNYNKNWRTDNAKNIINIKF